MGSNTSLQISELVGEKGTRVLGGLVVCAVTAAGCGLLLRYRFKQYMAAGETDRSTLTETDVIYLLMPPRVGILPNISPFTLKLETWFRLIDVPYKAVETIRPSTKKKQFPYIILNGEEIGDSRFIVEKVAEHFNKPVDPTLSAPDKAVSLAFIRMLEENTFYSYVWYRLVAHPEEFWALFSADNKGILVRKTLKHAPKILKLKGTKKFWEHGISRHTPAEIYSLAESDIKALSDFLDDGEYFFGNQPSLVDCVVFSHLAHIMWLHMNFPPRFFVMRQCKNLVTFLDRMKQRLYPDWDDLCNHQ